jgi:hypothetical protein
VPGDTANIVGVATADSNAVFNQLDTDVQGVFGQVQISATAGLMPFSPAFLLVGTVYGLLVEMSLSQAYSWVSQATGGPALTATIGTRVGLNVVGGTGGIGPFNANTNFYYADPAQAACGTIEALVYRPLLNTNISAVGWAGVRVLVGFDTTATLNIGH